MNHSESSCDFIKETLHINTKQSDYLRLSQSSSAFLRRNIEIKIKKHNLDCGT